MTDVVKEEEPIEEPQPKTRTKLSKILSSVTSEQPIVVKQVSKSSEESADETLGSVKFGTATTDLVASAKSEMSRYAPLSDVGLYPYLSLACDADPIRARTKSWSNES